MSSIVWEDVQGERVVSAVKIKILVFEGFPDSIKAKFVVREEVEVLDVAVLVHAVCNVSELLVGLDRQDRAVDLLGHHT